MSLFRDKVAQRKLSPFQEALDRVTPNEVFVRSVLAGGVTGALNISIVYPTEDLWGFKRCCQENN